MFLPSSVSFSRLSEPLGLAIVLGVALVVLLLYLLKPPPQRLEVASLQIWETLARQRSRRKDVWRWLLSLLLSVAVAVCLAAACTGAHVSDESLERPLLVVDTSASMMALRRDGRTRLEEAVIAAQRLGRGAVPPIGLTTTASDRLQVLHDSEALGSALQDLLARVSRRATAGSAGAPGASSRVPRFPSLPNGPFAPGDVVVLTDGVSALDPPPDAMVWSVYEAVRNVGLRAFELRFDPANPASAYIEVHNDSLEAVEAVVTLTQLTTPTPSTTSAGGRARPEESLVARQTLALAPSELWSGRVRLPPALRSGAIQAHVAVSGDRFAADDRAVAVLQPSRVRVFTDLDAGSSVARALASNPRVAMVSRVDAVGSALDRRLADVAILGRTTPDLWPEIPTIVFAPTEVDWLPSASEERAGLRVDELGLLADSAPVREVLVETTRVWQGNTAPFEPILALLEGSASARRDLGDGDDSGEAASALAVGLRSPPVARVGSAAAGAEGHTVAGSANPAGQRATVIALGFTVEDSNLARLPSFPVLLDELVRVLANDAANLESQPTAEGPSGVLVPAELDINRQRFGESAQQPEVGGGTRRTWLLAAVASLLLLEPVLRRWGITE